jgi:hypothetical protein
MYFEVAPSPGTAKSFLQEQSPKAMVLIIGDCQVRYRGRARSFLDFGERLVIIKRDRSVMVQRDTKCEPVNWQPPGSIIEYGVEDDMLTIYAFRNNPPEKMRINFRKIKIIVSTILEDYAPFKVVGMETDYVRRIMEEPELIEEGFRIFKREKKTASGSIDIYGVDSYGTPVIVEVKRSPVSPAAVTQLEAYVLDFKRKNQTARVRGILIAPKIPEMVKNLLLEKGLEYREVGWEFKNPDDKQKSLEEFR